MASTAQGLSDSVLQPAFHRRRCAAMPAAVGRGLRSPWAMPVDSGARQWTSAWYALWLPLQFKFKSVVAPSCGSGAGTSTSGASSTVRRRAILLRQGTQVAGYQYGCT